ncbi:cation-translocating P-type ATPase [Burkholderia cepacia]|uniref:cation-translocating P-type ATPase n=1 Tax=Burkholderia cepacia TaxID=292 RepID=UPI0019058715|nr:cation-translocating P-type ATPase [Burkholderia cepacia]MBJ9752207.1 cation-translocating P-type ATPase [Burkholderia cepacia]
MTGPWHTQSVEEVARHLASDPASGIGSYEALGRLEQYGPNEIIEAKQRPLIAMVAAQFQDFMILVLVAVAILSGILGDFKDSLVIVAIVILNAAIGFIQDFRAERAMAELKQLAALDATVFRDGQRSTIPAAWLVPGDVVLLEAGGAVPADMRLIDAPQLKVSEATLTGEAIPVEKSVSPLDDVGLSLADQTNMAFKGTMVTYGRARGMVVATGMDTQLGRIATLLEQAPHTATPLQNRLATFGRQLSVLILVLCTAIFVTGVLRGEPVLLMLLTAMSLAVAAIPEALPAVVTVMLALGARNMARCKALVRRLPAVETLGSVSYICTDKTGTLTLNEMRVVALYPCGGRPVDLESANRYGVTAQLLEAAALSNDAGYDERGDSVGDPTEVAMCRAATDAGFDKRRLEKAMPRCMEFAFDSDRKRMTTIHRAATGFVAYSKGAPEAIVERCTSMAASDSDHMVDGNDGALFERAALLAVASTMAADGLRVLAIARREWSALPEPDSTPDAVERDLTLLGFVGMRDPIRPGVVAAVATCRAAGITPVMITGDHPVTARAIARSLGLLGDGDTVMTGRELADLSDDELARRIEHVKVFARLDPAQKIRIVESIQACGHYVAMTGDGVNDAPALSRANIGVAMGQVGTDVAREASSVVLLDDDFTTIVAAVKEGRRIFDNIRKFIRYVLTCNAAELWVISASPILGLPMPLLPIHILWINLLTDGLPGLALAAEPAEPTIMQERPRPPRESFFAHGMWQHILWVGLAMAAVTLFMQAWALSTNHAAWQSMTFTVLALSQMGHVLAIRSERRSLFVQGLRANLPLLGAVALTVALQMAAIYVPALNTLLRTSALSLHELVLTLAVSAVIFLLVEFEKYLVRHALIYRSGRGSTPDGAKHTDSTGDT